ncbi:MAG: PAS domain S-box protein [Planctomycetes bacterium]|nr:PAS domain S-box protein [Planctomycetota bacterium]
MIRVLIVDDHAKNLYLLRVMLEGNGCEVDEARHGAEALSKARQRPPDLVISDLLMPVMDGYTLLAHWKADERLRSIPFVVYTATYTEPKDEKLALDLGASAFIVKPAEPEPFMVSIRSVLAAAAQGRLQPTQDPAADLRTRNEEFGEVLVRKVEQKVLQLEAANRELHEGHAEQLRTRAALRVSVDRFRAIFEQAAVGVAQIDTDGRWMDVNARLCSFVGYSRKELLATTSQAITHPDDICTELGYVRRSLAGEISSYLVEKRYRRGDGVFVWENVNVSLVRQDGPREGEQGKPLFFISVIEDIDARKRMEARLADAAANIELMVRASNIGLWDWDLTTNKVRFSREWKSQLGYSDDEISDDFSEWERRVHPDDLAPTLARVRAHLADPREPHTVEFRMRHRDGSWRWIYARGEILRDADGRAARFLGCHVDVTERKQAAELARIAAEREAAATVAAGVAHEFNSLLYAASLHIKQDASHGPGPTDSHAAKAIEVLREARVLAAALLDLYAGPEKGCAVAHSLYPWLPETVARLASALPPGVRVSTEVALDLPEVMTHPLGLEQVVRNLLMNAADAMSGEGHIHVSAEHATVDERAMVEVRVRDDGPGIPESLRARVFEPGFSTSTRSYRSGLGLAIAARLLEQFGASIAYESTQANGSTFVIRLIVRAEGAP